MEFRFDNSYLQVFTVLILIVMKDTHGGSTS